MYKYFLENNFIFFDFHNIDMAPEVIDDEKPTVYGRKADIFSLGALFYFLTFQTHAFVGCMYLFSILTLNFYSDFFFFLFSEK